MAGKRTPGPLGRNPETQDLNDGTMFRGLSPMPGPVGVGSTDVSAKVVTTQAGIIDIQHLVRMLLEAGSLTDLQQVLYQTFGPQCFTAGVIYGIGEDIITSAADLIQLCWTLILADLHDIHTSQKSLWDYTVEGKLISKAIAEAAALVLEDKMRRAAEERNAIISELMEALRNPWETFEGILDSVAESYKKDWKEFWENYNARTVTGQFQAGRIFGRLLVDVIGLILGVGAAAKLAAKLMTRFPRLVKLANNLKGKLGKGKKSGAGGGGPENKVDAPKSEAPGGVKEPTKKEPPDNKKTPPKKETPGGGEESPGKQPSGDKKNQPTKGTPAGGKETPKKNPTNEKKNEPKKEKPKEPEDVCFVAGTIVQTPDGPIPIDALECGQLVLAKGEGQPIAAYRVLDCMRGMTRKLYHIEVGGSYKFTSTRNHPFFVAGKGWTNAHKIEIGDGLIALDGAIVPVTAIDRERLIDPVGAFNIHVEDVRTYFVGDGLAVWVHNNDPKGPVYDEPLYWGFGAKGPRQRIEKRDGMSDKDGASTWRSNSPDEVGKFMGVRSWKDQQGNHGAFDDKQLASKGLVAVETPGDDEELIKKGLKHYSIRPATNPDKTKDLTDQEMDFVDQKLKELSESPAAKAKPKDFGC